MKNLINISNNVNLIINTYRCLFFQTAVQNLRLTDEMIDRWNVNKLTAARTKMEVGKLRARVAQ